MKKLVLPVLIVLVALVGVGCSNAPSDKSWENPEEFVTYDVQRYLDLSVENDQTTLEKVYGEGLARLRKFISAHFENEAVRPKIKDVDRFLDESWVTVQDVFLTSEYGVLSDEATFKYYWINERWQLKNISYTAYNDRGWEIDGMQLELERDIEYK